MRNAATPITLIVIGVLGLIWYFGWLPDVDAVTSIALVSVCVAILAMDGITKSSVVLGPTLIAVGIAWWLHDQYRMRWTLLISVLLILIGALMLRARQPRIPEKGGKSDGGGFSARPRGAAQCRARREKWRCRDRNASIRRERTRAAKRPRRRRRIHPSRTEPPGDASVSA